MRSPLLPPLRYQFLRHRYSPRPPSLHPPLSPHLVEFSVGQVLLKDPLPHRHQVWHARLFEDCSPPLPPPR